MSAEVHISAEAPKMQVTRVTVDIDKPWFTDKFPELGLGTRPKHT